MRSLVRDCRSQAALQWQTGRLKTSLVIHQISSGILQRVITRAVLDEPDDIIVMRSSHLAGTMRDSVVHGCAKWGKLCNERPNDTSMITITYYSVT